MKRRTEEQKNRRREEGKKVISRAKKPRPSRWAESASGWIISRATREVCKQTST
jgi:hypothetical protein